MCLDFFLFGSFLSEIDTRLLHQDTQRNSEKLDDGRLSQNASSEEPFRTGGKSKQCINFSRIHFTRTVERMGTTGRFAGGMSLESSFHDERVAGWT
mmetsp:Transcript_11894/g.18896  ORF Transcript_11894/g.18896 Transcript_11894/m.18896 type:complete len:96 (+) Transcript_11894:84-371(+)